jgi:hypothetical protein
MEALFYIIMKIRNKICLNIIIRFFNFYKKYKIYTCPNEINDTTDSTDDLTIIMNNEQNFIPFHLSINDLHKA